MEEFRLGTIWVTTETCSFFVKWVQKNSIFSQKVFDKTTTKASQQLDLEFLETEPENKLSIFGFARPFPQAVCPKFSLTFPQKFFTVVARILPNVHLFSLFFSDCRLEKVFSNFQTDTPPPRSANDQKLTWCWYRKACPAAFHLARTWCQVWTCSNHRPARSERPSTSTCGMAWGMAFRLRS